MVKKSITLGFLFIFFILVAPVSAEWTSPTFPPPTNNPLPPVWIQAELPGTTQPGNIHIGTNAAINGVLGLGGVPDTSRGQKIDINGSGNAPLVVRNTMSVVLGISPTSIGTITDHTFELRAGDYPRIVLKKDADAGTGLYDVKMGIGTLAPGNTTVAIQRTLPGVAFSIRKTGDVSDAFAVTEAGIVTAGNVPWARLSGFPSACSAGQFVSSIGAVLTCATPAVGGGGMANPMTSVGDIIYGGSAGAATRLAGSAGFLKSTGASAPTWSALTPGDIPDLGGSYIKNGTTLQSPANFNISGDGFIAGNVGIGTTTPTAKLHVVHAPGRTGVTPAGLLIQDSVNSMGVEFRNDNLSSSGAPSLVTRFRTIANPSNPPFYIGVNGRDLLVLKDTGSYPSASPNMGIGTNPNDVNARLVACSPFNPCNLLNRTVATVVALGSSNNANSGISLRAYGRLNAPGLDVVTSDMGEYVTVEGSSKLYAQGDVLVIASSLRKTFKKSQQSYDQKVAGIVTTTAGIVGGANLDLVNPADDPHRVVMALVGQVPAKVSVENGPIQVGDLLTTSSISGTLMKCPMVTPEEKLQCIGAVVAKALESLPSGVGKISVLLTLQ